jgi:hypothetical protein
VLTIERADAVTHAQARALRQQVVDEARRYFAKVHVLDSELEAARMLAAVWPGNRSRRLAAAVAAEQRAPVMAWA